MIILQSQMIMLWFVSLAKKCTEGSEVERHPLNDTLFFTNTSVSLIAAAEYLSSLHDCYLLILHANLRTVQREVLLTVERLLL